MTQLRPDYTDYLLKKLDKNSLNIYAPSGQGQLRLLEDLQKLLLERGDWVFLIKMKSYAENYEGFIRRLAIQIEKLAPEFNADSLQSLADIFKILDDSATEHRSILLLHDFDVLLDNAQIDPKYNEDFFDNLNALKNRGHRLVCVTERPHNQSQVYIDKKVHGNSWLDLKRLPLPPLNYEQIKQALLEQDYKSNHRNFSKLVDAIKAHPQVYQFLEFVYPRLRFAGYDGLSFEERLERLHEEFDRDERDPKLSLKEVHKANKWIQRLMTVTGLNKFKYASSLTDILKKVFGKYLG